MSNKLTQKEMLINLLDGLPKIIKICVVMVWLGEINFTKEADQLFDKLDEQDQQLSQKILRNVFGEVDQLNVREDQLVKIYKEARTWVTAFARITNYSVHHSWKNKGEGEPFVNELLEIFNDK